ncbi:hypothetical protein M0P65_00720 [Candidatus Gracilibacteria bacterium]|nr:hypothetical protein [Candidatus Gracilibacteria bacterium]
MKNEQKASNIAKVFIGVFVVTITTTYLIYWLFGFEIAILYCISLATAIISMAFSGLENTIINKDKS